MYRYATQYLAEWKVRPSRKPLVIRGARQVGKSYLVRAFATEHFKNIIEINFEARSDLKTAFDSSDPQKIIALLEIHFESRIISGETLLFLDEIQCAPHILARLRYFYESVPGLHVIAAGSLLDFVLDDHEFSMPVGRVEFLNLGPMTFFEFLTATGNARTASFLTSWNRTIDFPVSIHDKCLTLFRQYLIVGGMPESVMTFAETGSFVDCDRVKSGILTTYRDDFAKYKRRANVENLKIAFDMLPSIISHPVKYSAITRDIRSTEISKALTMLTMARVVSKVTHSSCNGIPLGATENPKKFKLYLLDVGLFCSACGLSMVSIENAEDLLLVNSGAVCEQFVAQHLLYREEPYLTPLLHFWAREKNNAHAELDFVIQAGAEIVPVEVKAGKTGSLRSLNQFMFEKQLPTALRFNTDLPSVVKSSGRLPSGDEFSFNLLSLPCYLVQRALWLI